MDAASTLRAARRRSGLSQAALAARTATSQATVSAYERGHKQPSVATLARLLEATGFRLTVETAENGVGQLEARRLARTDRRLVEVLALAEALPSRHEETLGFPRLGRS